MATTRPASDFVLEEWLENTCGLEYVDLAPVLRDAHYGLGELADAEVDQLTRLGIPLARAQRLKKRAQAEEESQVAERSPTIVLVTDDGHIRLGDLEAKKFLAEGPRAAVEIGETHGYTVSSRLQWKVSEKSTLSINGPVESDIQQLMRGHSVVMIERRPLTVLMSSTTTYPRIAVSNSLEKQQRAWDSLHEKLTTGSIRIQDLNEILKHCGVEEVEQTVWGRGDVEDILRVARCLKTSAASAEAEWMALEENFPLTVDLDDEKSDGPPQGVNEDHELPTDFKAGLLARFERQGRVDATYHAASSSETFGRRETLPKNTSALKIQIGNEKLVEIRMCDGDDESIALHLTSLMKLIAKKTGQYSAFHIGLLLRGKQEYWLVVAFVNGRIRISHRMPALDVSADFPSLVLKLIAFEREKLARRYLGTFKYALTDLGDLGAYCKTGGQSFVFFLSEAKGVVKYVKRIDVYDRIARHHSDLADFDFIVPAKKFDDENRCILYDRLVPISERTSGVSPEEWKKFAENLWNFHERTNKVHLDLCPGNIMAGTYDQAGLMLNDLGSCLEEGDPAVEICSTEPFFDWDLVSEGVVSRKIDYVMLLRSIDWLMRGSEANLSGFEFNPSCMKGLGVNSLEQLHGYIEEVMAQ